MQVSKDVLVQLGIPQIMLTVGRLLNSKIEWFRFLNEGNYKSVQGSALAVSLVFKGVDWITFYFLSTTMGKSFKSHEWGIRTTLSAIGGYVTANVLAEKGGLDDLG